MTLRLKQSSRRCMLRWLRAALLLGAASFASQVPAQEPAASGKIYVVAHVDIIPPETAAGTKLVQQYVQDSRKDKGLVKIEAYAQIARLNHISIVEVWESQQAFDEHVAVAHTRQFRQQLDPKLGSPYDERLHQFLE